MSYNQPQEQGLGADIRDLLEVLLQEAIDRPDVSWAINAAKAAAEGLNQTGFEYEARRVGPHVLVTVYAQHLGRPRRNWASARVLWWDGTGDWETYVKAAMGKVALQVCEKLDMRSK